MTAKTWKQPGCPLADECIRKLWYIYTMEYYSTIKKNAFESVLMKWMELEPIIQSEVRKKNTNTVYWRIYMGFGKMVMMTLHARQQKRHTDKEQTFGFCRRKWRVGWFERIALKHIHYHMWNRLPVQVCCVRQDTQGLCTGITLRDGMGREVGGWCRMGGHMYTHGWFMSIYGKNHYSIVK